MRNLPIIAYGNSCHAKTWTNKATTFEDLCLRLSKTIRTTESVEEYPEPSKTERDRIKDKDGFVVGQLRDNRRKPLPAAPCLPSMPIMNQPICSIPLRQPAHMQPACIPRTDIQLRLRGRGSFVPMKRDVTSDEYSTIARYFTVDIGPTIFTR